MASIVSRIQVEVNHIQVNADSNPTANKARQLSRIKFVLHICTFVEDDNGDLQEQEASLISWGLSESEFGSDRHRDMIVSHLFEDGWLDQTDIDIIFDRAFSEANMSLEKEKKKDRSSDELDGSGRIIIIFRVEKMARKDDDDDDDDCMICMDKLVSSSKKKVGICMQCDYIFHRDCIEKWLGTSQICMCQI